MAYVPVTDFSILAIQFQFLLYALYLFLLFREGGGLPLVAALPPNEYAESVAVTRNCPDVERYVGSFQLLEGCI